MYHLELITRCQDVTVALERGSVGESKLHKKCGFVYRCSTGKKILLLCSRC